MNEQDASLELAKAAADLAADRKAYDIVFLGIGELSSVADYFVVCSGRSHIQVAAIQDRIARGLKEMSGEMPISVEGTENSNWVIMDYGDVVVHVFQDSVRETYDLERLWSQGRRWKYEETSPAEPLQV